MSDVDTEVHGELVDVTVAVRSEALVLRMPTPRSGGTDALVHALSAASPAPLPVVVDLRHNEPGTEQAVVESAKRAAEQLGVEWCVVSTRRRPLNGLGRTTGGPALFATARDALAALVLARQGYGPGWAQR